MSLRKEHRRILKTHVYRGAGRITVAQHMRDLGSHIGSAARAVAPTLTARIEKAATTAKQVGAMAFTGARREGMVLRK
eukprot:10481162-Alexandrium_andersonii.AAC.1